MIYDKIENINKYVSIHPNLKKALPFMAERLKEPFEERKAILDDDVYMIFGYGELKEDGDAFLEAHKVYADIQIILDGAEKHYAGNDDNEIVTKSYSLTDDIAFFDKAIDKELNVFYMRPGYFVLYLPGEYHAPAIRVDENCISKRCVVKVKM